MIRFLRHISIRMFISAVIWMPLCFIFFTWFGCAMHGKSSVVAALILFIIFFALGFLMNQTGRKLILKFLKEAKSWEQTGIYQKSEEKYIKALRIYDSFLLSPWRNRDITKTLTGAIAKFSLEFSIQKPAFNSAVASFLSMSPNDADVALLWLERLCKQTNEPCAKDKEILTGIAEVHFDNPEIVILIADIFTKLNYCDFTARKIYKEALKLPDLKQNTRTAIKKYLKKEDKRLFENLVSYDMSEGILSKEPLEESMISLFRYSFNSAISKIFHATSEIISETAYSIKKNQKNKNIAKLGISIILIIGIIILIMNNVSRFFPEKTPGPEEKHEIQHKHHKTKIIASDLFTIQVAAYLKKKYGNAYVTKLKAKGLDAYLSKTEGGGKTWFIVRISQFPDKKTAAEYGQKLKAKGDIDNFFVDNSSRRY